MSPIGPLLNRVCDIWGTTPDDPEVEDSTEKERLVFPGVPCRVDSILYRRSSEEPVTGGTQGIRRAIIYIQDPRLSYPTNFNENNWIMQNGIKYEIITIDEADDMFSMHHYEVNVQGGRYR